MTIVYLVLTVLGLLLAGTMRTYAGSVVMYLITILPAWRLVMNIFADGSYWPIGERRMFRFMNRIGP